MDLDFEKALTYISKDMQWGNKLLAGSGLILATVAVFLIPALMIFSGMPAVFWTSLILALLVSAVLWIIVSGYVCETAHRRIKNPLEDTLLDWKNFGELFILGLKYMVGYLLYFIPFMIVCGLFCTFCITGIVSLKNGFYAGSGFSFISMVFWGAITLFLYIITMVFLPMVMTNFFKEKKILSFVNLKTAFSLVRHNVANYFVLILLFIAITVLTQIVFSLLSVTIVGVIFLPLLYMYAYYVIADLCAQFALTAEAKEVEQHNTQPNDENAENPSC